MLARTTSHDDKLFVLEHWQEGANHINGVAGAFFTPQSLARDFAIEVCGYVHREKYERFEKITHISLEANCGIDTGMSLNDWHGVSVTTEIVVADFKSVRALRQEEPGPVQEELFSAA